MKIVWMLHYNWTLLSHYVTEWNIRDFHLYLSEHRKMGREFNRPNFHYLQMSEQK